MRFLDAIPGFAAGASHKSPVRTAEGDEGSVDNRGDSREQIRNNDSHESKNEPDASLYRKGKTASELQFMEHPLSDNRHGRLRHVAATARTD